MEVLSSCALWLARQSQPRLALSLLQVLTRSQTNTLCLYLLFLFCGFFLFLSFVSLVADKDVMCEFKQVFFFFRVLGFGPIFLKRVSWIWSKKWGFILVLLIIFVFEDLWVKKSKISTVLAIFTLWVSKVLDGKVKNVCRC